MRSSRNLGLPADKQKSLSQETKKKPWSYRQAGGLTDDAGENLNQVEGLSFGDDTESSSDLNSDPERSALQDVIPAVSHPIVLGSGLKRSLELDHNGSPALKRRRRRGTGRTVVSTLFVNQKDLSGSEDSTSPQDSQVDDPKGDSEIDWEMDGTENESPGGLNTSSYNDVHFALNPETLELSGSEDGYKARAKAFRDWVWDRPNNTTSVSTNISDLADYKSFQVQLRNRIEDIEPIPDEVKTTGESMKRRIFNVQVERSPMIQEVRLRLPVVVEEQRIMEAIHNNPVVIVCGATGSGKTTQIPQFLYEAGYAHPESPTPGMIGVTQPRRVAAVSSAKRVSDEMGDASDRVSFQVRYDGNVKRTTAIKYMTDGILLREIQEDFILKKYSAIILDEVHERSINTDILIGMLTRIVELRTTIRGIGGKVSPLKVVIMSATLRVRDFVSQPKLFSDRLPPVIEAEGRQYSVTNHFARRTQRDYLEETFQKVTKAHKKLPSGGMLVFLTGQDEINTLASRLKEHLQERSYQSQHSAPRAARNEPLDVEDIDLDFKKNSTNDTSDEDNGDVDSDGENDFNIGDDIGTSQALCGVRILPLYSQLPTAAQLRVFEVPPDNCRLIVLATNVAETSLTIPGVRYVFDCGRVKQKKYDPITGVQSFEIGWISKASAIQRSGRAGRTESGHCYRLYSSAVYERDFEEYAAPEILRTPVEGVVLQLKSMELQNIAQFPFPTSPDSDSLTKAESLLSYLGALSIDGKVTSLGRDLSIYPLSPRFSKMLCIGHQGGCIYLTIAAVVVLVVGDVFVPQKQHEQDREDSLVSGNSRRLTFKNLDRFADVCRFFSAFAAYSWAKKNGEEEQFCKDNGLRAKALGEAYQLWQQLLRIVHLNFPDLVDPKISDVPMPKNKQLSALKQIVAAGFIDQIAIRADLAPNPPAMTKAPNRAINVPYLTLFPSHEGRASMLEEKAVFIHPSSILADIPMKELPQYLVYARLQRSSFATIEGSQVPKVRMHPLTPVTGNQIIALTRGTPLLDDGIGDGKRLHKSAWVQPSLVGQKGSTPWPLPPQKYEVMHGSKA